MRNLGWFLIFWCDKMSKSYCFLLIFIYICCVSAILKKLILDHLGHSEGHTLHTCARTEPNSQPRMATLCTRVRERSQVRHPERRTLHTCSRTKLISPPGWLQFAHVFENGAKFAAWRAALCIRVRERSKVRRRARLN